MEIVTNQPGRRKNPALRLAVILIIMLGMVCLGVIFSIYEKIGKTPGELMDYVERRLEGHPKVEFIALPTIGIIRDILGEPSRKERNAAIFTIPSPPPLSASNPTSAEDDLESGGRVLYVGPSEKIRTVAEAAKLAKDGDTIKIQSGNYYGDVAVWLQKKLVIIGNDGNARMHAGGRSAEGKAIWVIRNGNFTIKNIDFIGAKVHDKNGAGIRFENGHLKIINCLFWGNQNGLLTTGGSNHKNAVLEIENSEFAYNGIGDGFTHNLYVGRIQKLKVTGSYFHHANVGHLLKSRANINQIEYNRLTDESGGRASYEIDLPNGGVSYITGNLIQQTRETENSTLVSYGAEGYYWPENRLYISNNTLVNDHPYGGTYLRAAPGVEKIISSNNILVGSGAMQPSNQVISTNDIRASWKNFKQASRFDYRLSEFLEFPFNRITILSKDESEKITPKKQYRHPRKTINIPDVPLSAGAFQPIH